MQDVKCKIQDVNLSEEVVRKCRAGRPHASYTNSGQIRVTAGITSGLDLCVETQRFIVLDYQRPLARNTL